MEDRSAIETGDCSSGTVNSSSRNDIRVCHCNKPAKLKKSWTKNNPGRRFYSCAGYGTSVSCNYFSWLDKEKVYGWPKEALLAAHDEIRSKTSELKELSRTIRKLEEENRTLCQMGVSEVKNEFAMEVKSIEEDFNNIKCELLSVRSEKKRLEKKCLKLEGSNNNLKCMLACFWFGGILCMLVSLLLMSMKVSV